MDFIVEYFLNNSNHMNTLCGEKAEIHNIQFGGMYSNHRVLNGYISDCFADKFEKKGACLFKRQCIHEIPRNTG
jgi:hypothetical protein